MTINLNQTAQEQFDQIRKNEEDMTRKAIIQAVFAIAVLFLFVFCLSIADASAASDGKSMTKQFEGFSSTIYKCTAGVDTIGYGFNVAAVRDLIKDKDVVSGKSPMTREAADKIFEHVYARAVSDARKYLGDDVFEKLDLKRQGIIIDMSYNLGYARLSGFKKLKAAIVSEDYAKAAAEMKNSKWYTQTGNRAKHHVENFK